MNKLKKTVEPGYRPILRSRHPSHDILRTTLPKLPFKCGVRFGSSTELPDDTINGGKRVMLNSIEAIQTSSNKTLMKTAFAKASVKTAQWFIVRVVNGVLTWHSFTEDTMTPLVYNETLVTACPLEYPIVAKHNFGSRGTGNTLIKSAEEFTTWIEGKNLTHYVFEKFYNFSREYRLHITKNGCFYTCRKMLKEDTPQEERWHRHDSNCVWILEENELFDKPLNWKAIVEDCVNAIAAVGLDIGCVDLKVQSSTDNKGRVRENPEWIVLETNSAPSFGDVTAQKYQKIIPKLLFDKYKEIYLI